MFNLVSNHFRMTLLNPETQASGTYLIHHLFPLNIFRIGFVAGLSFIFLYNSARIVLQIYLIKSLRNKEKMRDRTKKKRKVLPITNDDLDTKLICNDSPRNVRRHLTFQKRHSGAKAPQLETIVPPVPPGCLGGIGRNCCCSRINVISKEIQIKCIPFLK